MTAICAQDRWILDSAYGQWLDVVLARAELVVGLDYPRCFSLGRLARRTMMRLFDQDTICNGNRETLRQMLSPDSILVWHFRSFSRKRRRMRAWAADPEGPEVLLFRSPRQSAAWLRTLQEVAAAGDSSEPATAP
jgi:hypothetical protein